MASKKSAKPLPLGAITELHDEYGLYGPHVLTKRGGLFGAVELAGRDPDGLNRLDYEALSVIARNIYQHYGDDVTITQYFAHYDGERIQFKKRAPGVPAMLSSRREIFLNRKKLSNSRIVHFFEIAPSETLSTLKPLEIIKHLALSPMNADSRQAIKRAFGAHKAVVVRLDDLERQRLRVDQILQETVDKWSTLLNPRVLSTQEVWAFCRFLANLDPSMLTSALDESVPDEGWDVALTESDVVPTIVQGMDALALRGHTTRYARVCSVTQFTGKTIQAGIWASSTSAPARQPHNFVLMSRFSPYTKLQRAILFVGKEKELERRNFSFSAALSGKTSADASVQQMKPDIAQRMKELGEADMIDDVWGMTSAALVTWDRDPAKLRETSLALKSSANKSNMSVCWESAGITRAWQSFMPAGRRHSFREIPFTTTQFAATSQLFRASVGQPAVSDMEGEEAQYIMLSADGTPFHYSPWVNGRNVLFGIGPIGTGKTFTKNSIASHFLKYEGAMYRAIDIDPGSETLAKLFGEDGRIFRIDQEGGETRGFNPFAVCRGPDDDQFQTHLRQQILRMMSFNENPSMRFPSPEEQRSLDNAIAQTMRMPKNMQRLSTVLNHCSQEFRTKMARWVFDAGTRKPGPYAYLFDQPIDALGAMNSRLGVFNLAGVKNDPIALPLVMSELWYRTRLVVENESLRSLPKQIDVDESHALLGMPGFEEEIDSFIRTSRKWYTGFAFWSQSPREFATLKSWPALRSAASTLFFMADPEMDPKLYRETFLLTPGECDAIRNLIPKREAYIVQRGIHVSKKVILEVEPEQYVVNTSKAREAALRDENIRRYGLAAGIQKTLEAFGMKPTVEVPAPEAVDDANESSDSTKEVA